MAGEPRVLPARGPLRERLGDPDPMVRLGAAAEALTSESPPAGLRPELGRLVTDPSEETRKVALLALGRIGADAVPELAGGLDPAQPAAVRIAACQAAAPLGEAASPLIGRLCGCLSDPEELLRAAASIALSKTGVNAVASLARVLETANAAEALVAAADAAGGMGKPAAATQDALRKAASHPDARVGLACSDALGRVSGKPAAGLPGLIAASSSREPAVRADAVRRIGALREDGRGATKALLERARDADPEVRAAAALAIALTRADRDQTLDALGRLLRDPDPGVRGNAGIAAAHLKTEAQPLLPDLERLRDEQDGRLAGVGRAACDAVTGKEPERLPAERQGRGGRSPG